MKLHCSILLVSVSALLFAAGCGGSQPAPAQPVEGATMTPTSAAGDTETAVGPNAGCSDPKGCNDNTPDPSSAPQKTTTESAPK